MVKYKTWIPLLAAVLAFVSLAGLAAALIPAESLIDSDECPHEQAKLIKEDAYDEHNGAFLYYCSDCDSRFERIMIEDCFVNNLPEINGSEITYFGNWEVGNYDASNQYKRFNGVYVDNSSAAGTSYWLCLAGCNIFTQTSAFNPYCPAKSYNHRIGVAENGNDCAIVWTASRDGEIVLGATDFEFQNLETYNLVVEHNGKQVIPPSGKLLLSERDICDDAAFEREFAGVTISVKAGDRIYFRASRMSVDGPGANEAFMPSVTYVDHIPHLR